MNWLTRIFAPAPEPPPPPALHIHHVQSTDLTLDQWVTSPALVRLSYNIISTPHFQAMLSVLRNESPINRPPTLSDTHDSHVANAFRAEGYQLCLNNIEALARLIEERPHVEATFEPETGPSLEPGVNL